MKINKILSVILAVAMILGTMTTVIFADEVADPVVSGNVINVTAANAQYVLDGKYMDITGKTINFTESITDVLELARPTKYKNSKSAYYNYVNYVLETTPTSWSEDISSVMNSHSQYHRTMENVTFTANSGVTLAGFALTSGNFASSGYDYVRDVEQTAGVTHHEFRSMKNITFKGLTFISGGIDMNVQLAGCTIEGITVDGCNFSGTTKAAVNFTSPLYCKNMTVKNSKFTNCFQGIHIQGADGLAVVKNSFDTISHNAIAIQCEGDAASSKNPTIGKVIIDENYIVNGGDRAIRFNVIKDADVDIVNNIMVNSGNDDGQLIKATAVNDGDINLDYNYWDSKAVATAIDDGLGVNNPAVGVAGGDWTDIDRAVLVDYINDDTVYLSEDGNLTICEGVVYNVPETSATVYAAADDTINSINAPKATLIASGNLTFAGANTVGLYSPGFSGNTTTIGADASLAVVGGSRMTVGYGNIFNITGNIDDAKTADKTTVTPSLSIPAGISITGYNGAIFNVENAYISLGLTQSKNSVATGNFDIDFTNSIADFSNNLTFSTSKNGKTPVFDIDITDSVMNFEKNLDFANAACDTTIDNSVVTVGSSMRNDGKLGIINGSDLHVKYSIQAGEHAGNSGVITVDNANLQIDCSSTGHAVDGNGVGSIVIKNGGKADVDYITKSAITVDGASNLTAVKVMDDASITVDTTNVSTGSVLNLGTPAANVVYSPAIPDEDIVVDAATGEISVRAKVAEINGTQYYSLAEAYDAAQNGDTIKLINNILIKDILEYVDRNDKTWNGSYAFDLRVQKEITLDLNGKTLKSIGGSDSQPYAVICVDGNGVLTVTDSSAEQTGAIINASEAPGKSQTATIYNEAGDIIINGGTISNISKVADKAHYAIDNVTAGDVSLTINEGAKLSTDDEKVLALRSEGGSGTQTVNITGGEFNGIVWTVLKSGEKDVMNVSVSGGTFNGEEVFVVENYVSPAEGAAVDNVLITGGTFNGAVIGENNAANLLEDGFVAGGTYAVDPSAYLANGYTVVENQTGTYSIEEMASAIEVGFEETADPREYNIVLKGVDGELINDFESAHFTFENNSDVDYAIAPNTEANITIVDDITNENRISFYMNADEKTPIEIKAEKIILGTVRFEGYGGVNFLIKSNDAKVNATTAVDSIVETFTVALGNLSVNWDDTVEDNYTPSIVGDDLFVEQARKLYVDINFNNDITSQSADYTDMKVEVTGQNGEKHLGLIGEGTTSDTTLEVCDYATVANNAASLEFDVTAGYRYTVKVSGAG
ncbi:MAG: hypothetical protein U0M60_06970, partial [Clostridia bacterium]|nr:hypothetical protein [Clostridia bacterium]